MNITDSTTTKTAGSDTAGISKINKDFIRFNKMLKRLIIKPTIWRNVSKTITTSAHTKVEVKESDNVTHFGFETVKSSEKAEKGKNLQSTD